MRSDFIIVLAEPSTDGMGTRSSKGPSINYAVVGGGINNYFVCQWTKNTADRGGGGAGGAGAEHIPHRMQWEDSGRCRGSGH